MSCEVANIRDRVTSDAEVSKAKQQAPHPKEYFAKCDGASKSSFYTNKPRYMGDSGGARNTRYLHFQLDGLCCFSRYVEPLVTLARPTMQALRYLDASIRWRRNLRPAASLVNIDAVKDVYLLIMRV